MAQQLFQHQEGQSIGDLMPICGNRLCVCNGATAEMRKSYASRHCRGEDDYTLLKRVNCEDTSPEAIKLVLDREMQEYVTDCRYGLFPMWKKEGVTVDASQSNYIIWLRCRYKDYEVADCTAKISCSKVIVASSFIEGEENRSYMTMFTRIIDTHKLNLNIILCELNCTT